MITLGPCRPPFNCGYSPGGSGTKGWPRTLSEDIRRLHVAEGE
jgi:hypothetical protein